MAQIGSLISDSFDLNVLDMQFVSSSASDSVPDGIYFSGKRSKFKAQAGKVMLNKRAGEDDFFLQIICIFGIRLQFRVVDLCNIQVTFAIAPTLIYYLA